MIGVPLAALIAGHAVSDFLLQPRWILDRKDRPVGLAAHAGVLLAVHAAFYAPFVTTANAPWLAALVASHVAIDAAKVRIGRRHPGSLLLFWLDQLAHLAVLFWFARNVTPGGWTGDPETYRRFCLTIAGAAFLTTGAWATTAMVLARLPAGAGQDAPAGRLIGILERLLVYVLVLAGQWAAVGLVMAAKSIARFEDLKQRAFAEAYLVGTLTSVLLAVSVAVAVGAGW